MGLGKSYDVALLKRISGNTGAKHYHANNANELIEEFEKLTRETIDIVTDSDGDGLSDKEDEMPLVPNAIDYLGSPKHLKSVEERVNQKIKEELNERIKENTISHDSNSDLLPVENWRAEILMEDYDTFLRERDVDTTDKSREEYWKKDL